jgi:hypothetical protein
MPRIAIKNQSHRGGLYLVSDANTMRVIRLIAMAMSSEGMDTFLGLRKVSMSRATDAMNTIINTMLRIFSSTAMKVSMLYPHP